MSGRRRRQRPHRWSRPAGAHEVERPTEASGLPTVPGQQPPAGVAGEAEETDGVSAAAPEPAPDQGFDDNTVSSEYFDFTGMQIEARRRRTLGRLPSVLLDALGLVFATGRVRASAVLGLQLVGSALIGVEVLIGKVGLTKVLDTNRTGASIIAAVVPLVLLAVVGAFSSGTSTVATNSQRLLSELVRRQVSRRVLDVTDSVELIEFEQPRFYDQLQRVLINAYTQPLGIAQGVIGIVGGLAGMVGLAVAVLTIKPVLLPVFLVGGVPLWFLSRKGGKIEFEFSVATTPGLRLRQYLLATLTGREDAKEVRAFETSPHLRGLWEDSYAVYVEQLRRHVRRRLILSLLSSLIAVVLVALTLVFLIVLVDRHEISIAQATIAAAAIALLGSRLSSVVSGVGVLLQSALFFEDLRDFMGRAPAVRRALPTAQPDAPRLPFTGVRLEHVSFSYPTVARPSLIDVSMHIGAGEVVALVGENGSGKTTLAKILGQLYRPESGRVVWGEHDCATLDAADLREQIAVIFQDFVHYHLTAGDNIGLGRSERLTDLDGIVAAARRSGADRFLAGLPDGYDTPLSREFEGGRDLSVGQWQRVALARAFFRDAPFVILDEPSAALDPRAENVLFHDIRALLGERSVLLISHRFSSVRNADRIYVLHEGRIVEGGSHQELMREGGRYAELFTLQASAYRQGDDADHSSAPDLRSMRVRDFSGARLAGRARPVP